jgi:TRAP-type C4-dicarboxylate transport system substrate-binding protein
MGHIRRGSMLAATATVMAGALTLSACGAASNSSAGGGECGSTMLRLSHQWPGAKGGDGDFRAVLAQKFADQVAKKTNDQVRVQVFPNSSLVPSEEQYDAMEQGAIDLSVFPLDYASGRVPDFSITLMPALVRDHADARAWQDAEIGTRLEQVMENNGVKPLTWVWNAGAVGSKGPPVVSPDDVTSGMKMRAAGSFVEGMLKDAGAGITSLSSDEIYTAMQTGVLDAAVTSTGSFASYNLQEQVRSFTSPTQNTFWFMFEPLIISTEAFDELCAEHQKVLETVGKDLQGYAYTASEEDDTRVQELFEKAGVQTAQMDDAAFDEWQRLAQKQWQKYAQSAPHGQELLKLAKQASLDNQ